MNSNNLNICLFVISVCSATSFALLGKSRCPSYVSSSAGTNSAFLAATNNNQQQSSSQVSPVLKSYKKYKSGLLIIEQPTSDFGVTLRNDEVIDAVLKGIVLVLYCIAN